MKNSFVKSVAKFSISSWVNFFIGFFSVFITTRIFSPDVYGVLNLFNTASGVLVGFSCLGFDGAFIRFYYEPPNGWTGKELFFRCLLISCAAFGLITLVSLIFFYQDITSYLFNKISFYFAVLLFVNTLSLLILNGYFAQYYRISNDSFHFTVQQILVQFFSKMFVISAAFINPTIEVVLTMNTLGLFFLMVVYFYIQCKRMLPKDLTLSFSGFKPVFKFAVFCWPQTTALTLNIFIIPFIISTQLGAYSLGIYASAGFFVTAFGVIQSGFRTYWSAYMYANYKNKQREIVEIHTCVLVFVIVIFSIFLLLQHVAYLMIGEDFQASRLFFSFVLLEPLFSLLSQTTEYGMSIACKNHQSLIIFLISTLSNIIGTYVLLQWVGLTGAAIAASIAATIRFVLATWRGQKYYRSIESGLKTSLGVLLIILLASSNFIFNNYYVVECGVILLVLVMTFLAYRSCILKIVDNVSKSM